MTPAPVVGLTGGIGAGKSTVAALLAEQGAELIDADRLGHDVYRPGSEGFRQVVAAFGAEVVAEDGTIDRRALGARVFADPDARMRLNGIVVPAIAREVERRLAAARAADPSRPIVLEAFGLLEAGWRRYCDEVWVVSVRPETAIARVTASRGLTRDEVERRIAAQPVDADRRKLADVVIENDDGPEALRARVEDAWQKLESRRSAG